MLNKQQRLTREEFDDVFKAGKRIHTPQFGVIYIESQTLKVAVVVSKKVAKSAVVRNKIRRRVYSLFHLLNIPNGNYIVIIKPNTTTLTYNELQSALIKIIGRTEGLR